MSSAEPPAPTLPAWLEDARRSLVANPQLLLSGNVRDYVLIDRGGDRHARLSLLDALTEVVLGAGYDVLLVFDPIEGMTARGGDEARTTVGQALGLELAHGSCPMTLPGLTTALLRVTRSKELRVCVVIDFAARLTVQNESLTAEEHAFFSACEKLAHDLEPVAPAAAGGVGCYNQIIWVTTSDRDLPSWFLAGTDRRLRRTVVRMPSFDDRLVAARALSSSFPDARDADPQRRAELEERFAEVTDGVTLRGMVEVQRLARDLDLPLAYIEDAARSYRVGVTENPWRKPYLRSRLSDPSLVTDRVLGQDDAVRRSLDIIMRSVTGLNGAHVSSSSNRPRGVLFLAGPTGVGKTELAKALTDLIFGDEGAYIRFDMSEFSAEHAEARLIGAPPGYIGHDAGGELTNALREHPFSLVLFDEIEKAHPRILDKFLQILEDGRLTDGAGTTTFFTETVLVFTSNLGSFTIDESGGRVRNATPDMDRETLVTRYKEAIEDHFTVALNRPELLNRLGDNIVVFNYISPEVGKRILAMQLGNVARRIEQEYKARLEISATAIGQVEELALADLDLGGRGIGSIVESVLVNPLARAIFSEPPAAGDLVIVEELRHVGTNWELVLR